MPTTESNNDNRNNDDYQMFDANGKLPASGLGEGSILSRPGFTKENSLKNKKVIKLLELWTLWLKNMKKIANTKELLSKNPPKL